MIDIIGASMKTRDELIELVFRLLINNFDLGLGNLILLIGGEWHVANPGSRVTSSGRHRIRSLCRISGSYFLIFKSAHEYAFANRSVRGTPRCRGPWSLEQQI
jgi:hypothetical protein